MSYFSVTTSDLILIPVIKSGTGIKRLRLRSCEGEKVETMKGNRRSESERTWERERESGSERSREREYFEAAEEV